MKPIPTIPSDQFGRDHKSVLLYIESCNVDRGGVLNLDHLRCNQALHPGLGGRAAWKNEYSTRLNAKTKPGTWVVVEGHDDHHCCEDMVACGWLEDVGTGAHPVFKLTDEGWKQAGLLRRARAERKN